MSAPPGTGELAARYRARREEVDAWCAAREAEAPWPLYASADVRDTGFKAAPVDLNLFPAGYNNLDPACFPDAVAAWGDAVRRAYPDAHRICLIPEGHTRNQFYLQNVATIRRLLAEAGFAPEVATVDPRFRNPETQLTAADGTTFTLYRAERDGPNLVVHGTTPDLIILNNDLAAGMPEALDGVAQPVAPPVTLGWHARRKSEHAAHYARLAAEWGDILGIDPWRITPMSEVVEGIDFHEPDTFGPLSAAVDRVRARTAEKYGEYGIGARPYCFVKDDAGTYGMGIITARSGEEIAQLNRKQRNKMDRGKANTMITRVLVQEGLPTVAAVEGAEAEPVLYAVGARIIGGFYRYHPDRAAGESLNAKGARFRAFPPGSGPGTGDDAVRELYEGLTRLALAAAACEIRDRAPAIL